MIHKCINEKDSKDWDGIEEMSVETDFICIICIIWKFF